MMMCRKTTLLFPLRNPHLVGSRRIFLKRCSSPKFKFCWVIQVSFSALADLQVIKNCAKGLMNSFGISLPLQPSARFFFCFGHFPKKIKASAKRHFIPSPSRFWPLSPQATAKSVTIPCCRFFQQSSPAGPQIANTSAVSAPNSTTNPSRDSLPA